MFKKATFLPSQPRRAKTRRFHGQGRKGSDGGAKGASLKLATSSRWASTTRTRAVAIHGVREHDKNPRTTAGGIFQHFHKGATLLHKARSNQGRNRWEKHPKTRRGGLGQGREVMNQSLCDLMKVWKLPFRRF